MRQVERGGSMIKLLALSFLLTSCAVVSPVVPVTDVDCTTVNPRPIIGLVEQNKEQTEFLCGAGTCGCIVKTGRDQDELIIVVRKYAYECLRHEVEHAICGDRHEGEVL